MKEFGWDLTEFFKNPTLKEFNLQAGRFNCAHIRECGKPCPFFVSNTGLSHCGLNQLLPGQSVCRDGKIRGGGTNSNFNLSKLYTFLLEKAAAMEFK